MVKNVIVSVVIVGCIILVGYYIFGSGNTSVQTNSLVGTPLITTEGYSQQNEIVATTTSEATQKPVATVVNPKTKHMITIETNYGNIVFETYTSDAPKTVENFVTLANKGYYNGLIFHRVIPGFMIQGGDPNGNGTGGPGYTFADELDPNTASYKAGYKKGVVAMANAGPNTNGSQFFIMLADYPLSNNYTIFGKVVSGQDVVDTIGQVQTGANDKPVKPVVMNKVTVK